MHTYILTLHLLVATLTTFSIIGVFVSAHARRESRSYLTMLVSFAATAVSGIALVAVSAHGLGRFCAMMSAYVLVVAAARSYYRSRTVSVTSL